MRFSPIDAFLAAFLLQSQRSVGADPAHQLLMMEKRANCSGNIFKDQSAKICASDQSLRINRGSFLHLGHKSVLDLDVDSVLRLEKFSVLTMAVEGLLKLSGDRRVETLFRATELSHVTIEDGGSWSIDPGAQISVADGSQVRVYGRWSTERNGRLTARRSRVLVSARARLTLGPDSHFRLTDASILLGESSDIRWSSRDGAPLCDVRFGSSSGVTLDTASTMFIAQGSLTLAPESEIYQGYASIVKITGYVHISNSSAISLARQASLIVGPERLDESGYRSGRTRLIFGPPKLTLEIGVRSMLTIDRDTFCLLIGSVSIFGSDLVVNSTSNPVGSNMTCFDTAAKLNAELVKNYMS